MHPLVFHNQLGLSTKLSRSLILCHGLVSSFVIYQIGKASSVLKSISADIANCFWQT